MISTPVIVVFVFVVVAIIFEGDPMVFWSRYIPSNCRRGGSTYKRQVEITSKLSVLLYQ